MDENDKQEAEKMEQKRFQAGTDDPCDDVSTIDLNGWLRTHNQSTSSNNSFK
jgi:hypothetical protein